MMFPSEFPEAEDVGSGAQQGYPTAEQGTAKAGTGPLSKLPPWCQLLPGSPEPQFLCLDFLFQENINIILCCFLTALLGRES